VPFDIDEQEVPLLFRASAATKFEQVVEIAAWMSLEAVAVVALLATVIPPPLFHAIPSSHPRGLVL